MATFRAAAVVALLVVLGMAMDQAQAECPGAAAYLSCQSALTQDNVMPTEECCLKVQGTLAAADGSGPRCLCEAMTSALAQTVNVKKEQAVLLPSRCHEVMGLEYVKNYNCAGLNVP